MSQKTVTLFFCYVKPLVGKDWEGTALDKTYVSTRGRLFGLNNKKTLECSRVCILFCTKKPPQRRWFVFCVGLFCYGNLFEVAGKVGIKSLFACKV